MNIPLEFYTVSYIALFDIFKNIDSCDQTSKIRLLPVKDPKTPRKIFDDLIPMSGDMISAKTFKHNITDTKNMNPATGLSNMLDMLFSAGLKRKDISNFIQKMQEFYKADLPGRLKLTAGKTFGEYLDYP